MNKTTSPQVRFKEFQQNWSPRKIKDLAKVIGGGTPSTKNLNYWKGDLAWISSSDLTEDDIHNVNITRFITEEAVQESATKLIPKESVLVVSRVGVGKVAITKNKICTSQDFQNIVPNRDKVNYIYLAYLLSNKLKIFLSYNQGTSIKGFTKKDLMDLKIILPSLAEQEKIADFFSTIDNYIENLKKQKEALKSYKKGVMQKIFKQEIRFKDDDGNEFPEWEKKKLGEYLELSSLRNTDKQLNRILSVSNKHGFTTQAEQFENHRVASKNISNYKKVFKGDFAYNPSRINVGSIAQLKNFSNGVVSPMYIVFKLNSNLDSVFFENYIQTHRFKHLVKVGCSGSVRESLNFEDMQQFEMYFPSLLEQQKIASSFELIDSAISIKIDSILKLETWKKGLMQKMFV